MNRPLRIILLVILVPLIAGLGLCGTAIVFFPGDDWILKDLFGFGVGSLAVAAVLTFIFIRLLRK